MENSIRFNHDCNCCTFIGQDNRERPSDVYLCPTHDEIIMRFGDDESHYRAYPRELYLKLNGGQ